LEGLGWGIGAFGGFVVGERPERGSWTATIPLAVGYRYMRRANILPTDGYLIFEQIHMLMAAPNLAVTRWNASGGGFEFGGGFSVGVPFAQTTNPGIDTTRGSYYRDGATKIWLEARVFIGWQFVL
jgi:hypothetical protein